jgi:hypothetical protein
MNMQPKVSSALPHHTFYASAEVRRKQGKNLPPHHPLYTYIGAAVAPKGRNNRCGKHLQNVSALKAADALLFWSVPNPHHAATPHLAPLAGRKASGADRPDDLRSGQVDYSAVVV